MIDSTTTLAELAGIVASTLARHEISAVLVGGCVVSLYTENAYESGDLDFVTSADRATLAAALATIGFLPDGRHYAHPGTDFIVEFPPGPLAVGGEVIGQDGLATVKLPTGVVRLLSPTICVMDRLAAYYHWDDRQSLDLAVAVARAQPVHLDRIRAWSDRERNRGKFEIFLKSVGAV